MTKRSTWLSLAVSLCVMLSMALVGFANSANAAAPSKTRAANHTAAKAKAKASATTRCKTRTKATGTIKWSDWQFPDTFSPYTGGNLAVTALNTNFTNDGLLFYNNKVKLQADMLARIPSIKNGQIKDGGRTIVLALRKGMEWSNGKPITSKDIKFSWQVNMDKLTGPACSGSCDAIARIDTPDAYTDVLHMKRVYGAAIPYALEFYIMPAVYPGAWNNNAHAAATKQEDPTFNYESSSYITSGPYQVSEFVKDDRIVYKPMKHYSILSCGGAISTVIFAFYSDKNAMIAAAASRQTDMTQDYTVADLTQLQSHGGSYKVYSDPGFFFEHLELNEDPTFQGKPNPLSNVKVRQAVALAIDKYGLLQSALSINRSVAKQIIAWTPLVNSPKLHQPFADKTITGQWDPISKKYRSDTGSAGAIADAKKLLDQTSFKDGFTLQMYTTSGNPVRAAQLGVVAAGLKKIGITAVPNFVPAGKFFAGWDQGGTLDHGDFQLADFAYIGQPDPDQLKFNLVSRYCDRRQAVHTEVNANDSCVQSSTIDKAFAQQAGSFDPKVRQKAFTAMQVEINRNTYWVPLYSRPSIATVSPKLKNFANNPTQFGQTWNAYAWAAKS